MYKKKESIQPQVPLRLPCYDFAPVTNCILGLFFSCFLVFFCFNKNKKNKQNKTSDIINFQSVTGGEYKAQVQIHRGVLIHDY